MHSISPFSTNLWKTGRMNPHLTSQASDRSSLLNLTQSSYALTRQSGVNLSFTRYELGSSVGQTRCAERSLQQHDLFLWLTHCMGMCFPSVWGSTKYVIVLYVMVAETGDNQSCQCSAVHLYKYTLQSTFLGITKVFMHWPTSEHYYL